MIEEYAKIVDEIMEESKPTVGKEALKRLEDPDSKQGIVDTQREIDKGYFEDLHKCIDEAKKREGFDGNFFIVVLQKKEVLMQNVVRRYFVARQSLPTPDYDQTVWYYRKGGTPEYLWTIPNPEYALLMYNHPLNFPPDHKELLGFVRDFMESKLYRKTCERIGIKPDIPGLILE